MALPSTLRSRQGDTATALLGASGCGKSMTLRCIAGIVRPDEGRIVLDGRVLFDSAQGIDLPPQQRNVGLLFQNYALFPNMTVEQNILCALKKEKDPAARRGRLCRGIACHAAGGTGQAPARRAFGRAAAACRPGPHPGGQTPHPDAGRAVQCAGQLSARGGRGGGRQPAGRICGHGPCW